MTLPHAVAALIAARRLEQVPADLASAKVRLSRAEDKLEPARKIADLDVEIAYADASIEAVKLALSPPGRHDTS